MPSASLQNQQLPSELEIDLLSGDVRHEDRESMLGTLFAGTSLDPRRRLRSDPSFTIAPIRDGGSVLADAHLSDLSFEARLRDSSARGKANGSKPMFEQLYGRLLSSESASSNNELVSLSEVNQLKNEKNTKTKSLDNDDDSCIADRSFTEACDSTSVVPYKSDCEEFKKASLSPECTRGRFHSASSFYAASGPLRSFYFREQKSVISENDTDNAADCWREYLNEDTGALITEFDFAKAKSAKPTASSHGTPTTAPSRECSMLAESPKLPDTSTSSLIFPAFAKQKSSLALLPEKLHLRSRYTVPPVTADINSQSHKQKKIDRAHSSNIERAATTLLSDHKGAGSSGSTATARRPDEYNSRSSSSASFSLTSYLAAAPPPPPPLLLLPPPVSRQGANPALQGFALASKQSAPFQMFSRRGGVSNGSASAYDYEENLNTAHVDDGKPRNDKMFVAGASENAQSEGLPTPLTSLYPSSPVWAVPEKELNSSDASFTRTRAHTLQMTSNGSVIPSLAPNNSIDNVEKPLLPDLFFPMQHQYSSQTLKAPNNLLGAFSYRAPIDLSTSSSLGSFFTQPSGFSNAAASSTNPPANQNDTRIMGSFRDDDYDHHVLVSPPHSKSDNRAANKFFRPETVVSAEPFYPAGKLFCTDPKLGESYGSAVPLIQPAQSGQHYSYSEMSRKTAASSTLIVSPKSTSGFQSDAHLGGSQNGGGSITRRFGNPIQMNFAVTEDNYNIVERQKWGTCVGVNSVRVQRATAHSHRAEGEAVAANFSGQNCEKFAGESLVKPTGLQFTGAHESINFNYIFSNSALGRTKSGAGTGPTIIQNPYNQIHHDFNPHQQQYQHQQSNFISNYKSSNDFSSYVSSYGKQQHQNGASVISKAAKPTPFLNCESGVTLNLDPASAPSTPTGGAYYGGYSSAYNSTSTVLAAINVPGTSSTAPASIKQAPAAAANGSFSRSSYLNLKIPQKLLRFAQSHRMISPQAIVIAGSGQSHSVIEFTAPCHVYVVALPPLVDEATLRKVFKAHGQIEDIRLSRSRNVSINGNSGSSVSASHNVQFNTQQPRAVVLSQPLSPVVNGMSAKGCSSSSSSCGNSFAHGQQKQSGKTFFALQSSVQNKGSEIPMKNQIQPDSSIGAKGLSNQGRNSISISTDQRGGVQSTNNTAYSVSLNNCYSDENKGEPHGSARAGVRSSGHLLSTVRSLGDLEYSTSGSSGAFFGSQPEHSGFTNCNSAVRQQTLVQQPVQQNQPLGIAYIKFVEARSATNALLNNQKLRIGGTLLEVRKNAPLDNPTRKLFLANLWDVRADVMHELCSQFGPINTIDVVADRGMMFVHFFEVEHACEAHSALQGLVVNKRYVRVEFGQSASGSETIYPGLNGATSATNPPASYNITAFSSSACASATNRPGICNGINSGSSVPSFAVLSPASADSPSFVNFSNASICGDNSNQNYYANPNNQNCSGGANGHGVRTEGSVYLTSQQKSPTHATSNFNATFMKTAPLSSNQNYGNGYQNSSKKLNSMSSAPVDQTHQGSHFARQSFSNAINTSESNSSGANGVASSSDHYIYSPRKNSNNITYNGNQNSQYSYQGVQPQNYSTQQQPMNIQTLRAFANMKLGASCDSQNEMYHQSEAAQARNYNMAHPRQQPHAVYSNGRNSSGVFGAQNFHGEMQGAASPRGALSISAHYGVATNENIENSADVAGGFTSGSSSHVLKPATVRTTRAVPRFLSASSAVHTKTVATFCGSDGSRMLLGCGKQQPPSIGSNPASSYESTVKNNSKSKNNSTFDE